MVGIGQTANCSDGSILQPSATVLQLNGGACEYPGYVSCAAIAPFLELSSCVNTCPDPILPVETPEGVWKCITSNGQYDYNPNMTNIEGAGNSNSSPTSSASTWLNSNNVNLTIMIALMIARFARK